MPGPPPPPHPTPPQLAQNADDARASRIAFVNDRRSFTTDDLLGPGLGPFQGPALLAYNDAVFTERDFESISRVGDSKKRGVAGKTGRFGCAFHALRGGLGALIGMPGRRKLPPAIAWQ
jgi:hypothetical protein